MVTIKTKSPLINLKGEALRNPDTTELIEGKSTIVKGAEIAVGDVIANLLSGQGIDNPARAYQFAKKFANDELVDLKAEDVVYIKKQIEGNKNFSALVSGQLLELLDK